MGISFLSRPEGRIAYEMVGTADPVTICVPGMGELRQSYRFLTPLLVAGGFRVATMDLRGHGDSDATFTAYDDEALASDILALIDDLGAPAFVVGNSMGAGAAVIAAATSPTSVKGLALLGPFVRDAPGRMKRLLFRFLMMKPWGPAAFLAYHPQWLPGQKPDDYSAHVERLRENLRRPGHWSAFVQTTRTSHAAAEERLQDVTAHTVIVMGDADVDWEDPASEAAWIGEQMNGHVVLLPGVGHYPQVQAPDETAAAVLQMADGAIHG